MAAKEPQGDRIEGNADGEDEQVESWQSGLQHLVLKHLYGAVWQCSHDSEIDSVISSGLGQMEKLQAPFPTKEESRDGRD